MTRNEFAALCGELLIDPAVALENPKVREALKNKKDVRKVLEEEF